jgi:hypothetical protein
MLCSCIDHAMHRAAYHFIKALGIPSISKKRTKTRAEDDNDGEPEEDGQVDDDADIDVSMDIEASADDPEAMESTTVVEFEPGDTLGKLLALVNQVRMSSEGVREYLACVCAMNSVKPIELRLWVRSRWGSLSDCLEVALRVQKVLLFPI